VELGNTLYSSRTHSPSNQTGSFRHFRRVSKPHRKSLNQSYYRIGARYYDSDIGGWVSVDPMRQFASPYDYSGGNPVNRIDPDGNQVLGAQIRISGDSPAGWSLGGGGTFSLMFDFGRLSKGKNPFLWSLSGDYGGSISTGGGTFSAGFLFNHKSPTLGWYATPSVSVVASEVVGLGGVIQPNGTGRLDLGLYIALGVQASIGGGIESGYIGEISVFQETVPIVFESNNSATYEGSTSSDLMSSSSSTER